MNRLKKIICLVLLVLIAAQTVVLPAMAKINFITREVTAQTSAAPAETTVSDVQLPEETVPAEEMPGEEVPAEQPQSAEQTAETVVAGTYDEVPLYFQTDYPDVMYANDTLATSGCSMTSLAMVATYLTGHYYSPADLADWFGGYMGNHQSRLVYASNELQLPFTQANTIVDAMQALKDGKVVIALMSKNSLFTNSQHFVVFSGITVDGMVLVNDPYEPNYTHWLLVEGFEHGFTQEQVTQGFSGGWIYDKDQVPANPYIYEPEEYPDVECRYPGVELTDYETLLLAKLLWLECRGEPYDGQQAVAEVVLNRLASEYFPNSIYNIIYAEGQFPCADDMHKATPNQTQYEAIERALNGPYVLPEEVVFYAKHKQNKNFWGKIGEHYFCYGYDWKPEVAETEVPAESTGATEPGM